MGGVFLLGRDYFYLQRPYFACRNSMILEGKSSSIDMRISIMRRKLCVELGTTFVNMYG